MRRALGLAAALWLAAAAVAGAAGRRMLVAFEPGTGGTERAKALKAVGTTSVEDLGELDAVVAEVPDKGLGVSALEAEILASPFVRAVEEDVYVKWLSAAEAGVERPTWQTLEEARALLPRFVKSEAPAAPLVDPAELPWGIARVNAPAAWAVTQGEGVRVAVIDTGIDASHPDLKERVAGGYNAFSKNASYFDDNSHGTHVSGTIAGSWDGKGVVGVAPKAKLYAVKVLDKDGGANLSSLVKGLVWCGKNNIQVANMSLGAPTGFIFVHLAVNYAASKGVALIAAAGNNGRSVEYPAGYADAIAVAASDSSDKIASFSSRGSKVEFIAPGVAVRSSIPGGGFDSYSGTSMATPHVAGLAALAVARGARGVAGVRSALSAAAGGIGLEPSEQGRGMIDAAKLVR